MDNVYVVLKCKKCKVIDVRNVMEITKNVSSKSAQMMRKIFLINFVLSRFFLRPGIGITDTN